MCITFSSLAKASKSLTSPFSTGKGDGKTTKRSGRRKASANIPPRSRNDHLLPNIVDLIAREEPTSTWCEFPASNTTYDDGFRIATYGQLANAINGAAWWLENTLGKGKNFETITYVGPNDVRYPILVLGAVKAGYKLLLTSPRNSQAAHVNLFKLLDCTTMITSSPVPAPVTGILSSHAMRVAVLPSLDALLDQPHEHYPYEKTWAESCTEPLAVLHTSGSTGLPKPIIIPHTFATAFANMTQFQPPQGYVSEPRLLHGNRLFCSLPPFHAVGLYFGLFSPVFNKTIFISPLANAPPSGAGMLEALKHTTADSAFVAPSILEDVTKDPLLLDQLAGKLRAICYSGGDLPQPVGDVVASRMRLFTIYGTTEFGHGPQIGSLTDWSSKDWKYIKWRNDVFGMELRHYAGDLHELWITRTKDMIHCQPMFALFPDKNEVTTKDLFSPHPTRKDLWMYRGRADDIIVFLNGEKTNPLSMEGLVSSHPAVRSALVIGAQRLQAALLIELTNNKDMSPQEELDMIDQIWPAVENANKECPRHAKVSKTHIVFVKPNKPMVRAGKGTVVRQQTLNLYADETDDLYAAVEDFSAPPSTSLSEKTLVNPDELQESLRKIILEVTGWKRFDKTDDFFAMGMDSLQAMQIAQKIRSFHNVSPATIYSRPSLASLASAIAADAGKHADDEKHSLPVSPIVSRKEEMRSTYETYEHIIDSFATSKKGMAARHNSRRHTLHQQVVLLTGSTGALGSYILDTLIKNSQVAHVFCLNRASDSAALQAERNQRRGLTTPLSSDRITFLTADLSKPETLGLDASTLAFLAFTVTNIIHNAWPVNFNLSLPSFAPQLAGIANLATFAANSTHTPSILFVSSISSVQSWTGASVPEEIIPDFDIAGSSGYGESKHIAERLLDHAAKKLNVAVRIARLGQIAGPLHLPGQWNRNEWLPSLVASSLHIGALPQTLGAQTASLTRAGGEIDWVPVDILATIIAELSLSHDVPPPPPPPSAFHQRGRQNSARQHSASASAASPISPLSGGGFASDAPAPGATVFHPVNSRRTTWASLLPTVLASVRAAARAQGRDPRWIATVPFPRWCELLRASATVPFAGDRRASAIQSLAASNPGIKLLDFYEALARTEADGGSRLVVLDTRRTREASAALSGLEPVTGESMKVWMRHWLGGF